MLKQTKEYLAEAFGITEKEITCVQTSEVACCQTFQKIDAISEYNQAKVLKALQEEQIAARHFSPSTGYGYDDIGRDALERVFTRVFGCEDALVRPQIASGTHAIALVLFGLLLPNDEMLSITGKPYDTLEESIGIRGEAFGSLKQYGISYKQVELTSQGEIDLEMIKQSIHKKTKIVYIQRSRGYSWRESLSIEQIQRAIIEIRKVKQDVIVVVDNCYGEFTDIQEPIQVGADVMAGSLIKNPGGGLAPTGGYIAGTKICIGKIANRLTSPGIGREVGSYAAMYTPFFQGLFLAPHVVAQALKGMVLAAHVYQEQGFTVLPSFDASRNDIIQAIQFKTKEQLIAFCQAIQSASPIDSHVTPEPWDMPGYEAQVIMAAGAFVQGASIELSADAPIKDPYIVYMQGGLTYEHVKLAVMITLKNIIVKEI